MAAKDEARQTVVSHIMIPAPVEEIWRYLTVPQLVSEWFADTESAELKPGRPVRFDFGDGDYFDAVIDAWEPPTVLKLNWKFMGVGPLYRIVFSLEPVRGETRVKVQDTGALSREEAEELTEGWADFLARLHSAVILKKPARYEWSERIGAAALLQANGSNVAEIIQNSPLLRAFPGSRVFLNREGDGHFKLVFRDDVWEGRETEASLTTCRLEDKICLKVTHSGWAGLPQDIRVAERRRYAGLWARFLKQMEG